MPQHIRRFAHSLVAAAILAGAISLPASAQLTSGIDTTNFDHSIRPQDDFYRYVNGGWLKTAKIPADASSWGAFQELRENSRNAEHELFESASKANAPAGSPQRKVGDLYASYMDTARVDKLGTASLQPLLRSISDLKVNSQLPAVFAHFAQLGVNGPVGVFVGADGKHSTENIVQLTQSGLGMPDRDYYLQAGSEDGVDARGVRRLHHAVDDAREAAGSRGRRLPDSRARNSDRDAAVGARAESRPQCDVQQDDGGRACGVDAVVQLDALPRPGQPEKGNGGRRSPAGLRQSARSDFREHTDRHLARVSHLSRHRSISPTCCRRTSCRRASRFAARR